MNIRNQVLTFSQSEKIKSALIWIAHCAQILPGLAPSHQRGAENVMAAMVSMVLDEVHLIRRLSSDTNWIEVEKHIDLALVMINSGVASEAAFHVTNALTHVTTIGRGAMSVLKDSGIL